MVADDQLDDDMMERIVNEVEPVGWAYAAEGGLAEQLYTSKIHRQRKGKLTTPT